MLIRELPPLRHTVTATTPAGRRHRWAMDEPAAENILGDLRWTDAMPGGFERLDTTLARDPAVDYPDLERLTTLTVADAAGNTAGEYRLERAPETSGDEMAIAPAAVGWQAALEDDQTVREIYIDRDLGRWQGPSAARKIDVSATYSVTDGAVQPNETTGAPTLRTAVTGPWAVAPGRPLSESWYTADGIPLGKLLYEWARGTNISAPDTNWFWAALLATDDTAATADTTGDLRAAGPASGQLVATAVRTAAGVQLLYANVAGGGDNTEYPVDWSGLAVLGTHGLPLTGTPSGVLASDVVAHAVGRWCPALTVGTIQPTGYAIPQLAFGEPTTVAEIVRAANRFHLYDWAVWEHRKFHYRVRGAGGREWRVRTRPANLTGTGPQLDRLWESVTVAYRDYDGSSRTAGPPGSGATVEDQQLKDLDPENPANRAGIPRHQLLQAGVLSGAAAVEVGARFLEGSRLLDTSGSVELVGHVEDDRGVLHPYSAVRSGDRVRVVDAADTSPRRVVRTEKSHATRTCSADLDSPPDGMQALLERLGVAVEVAP